VNRSQVGELFYITHVANAMSIATIGILSHNRAAKLVHTSVALDVIQERRERVAVGARMLHDHANLYLCGRNPMMYHVIHHNPIDQVCLLRISPDVLDLPGVAVASFNASRWGVRFDPPIAGLAKLAFDEVHERDWRRADDVEQYRLKGIKCAEVLVPDVVEPRHILGAYAPTAAAHSALSSLARIRDVRIAPEPFFR
jgi:hypothetical protein